MSTKVIPEQHIFVCDRCELESQPRRAEGKLIFMGARLDVSGYPFMSEKEDMELCDSCQEAVFLLIRKDKKEMRSAASAQ